MSRLRSVSTAFWSDPLVEELNPHEKLLYLYLITNEKTNMLGIYENSAKKTAFETGLTTAQVEAIYKRFEELGRIRRLNGWLMVLNFAKHQNYNTNMKKSAIDCYLALPEELQNTDLEIDRDNPTEGFERILKHLGMVRNPSATVRKVEVEYEVEEERELEAAKADKKIATIASFERHKDDLILQAKDKYPNKNVAAAFADMFEYCKINGKRYADYKLAYFRWVREDTYNKYDVKVQEMERPIKYSNLAQIDIPNFKKNVD